MSKVFSFRLNESNPREARAMEILKMKINNGISFRQVITDGLLANDRNPSPKEMYDEKDIQSTLDEILKLLTKANHTQSNDGEEDINHIERSKLSDKFIEILKKDVKKGIHATN